MSGQEQTIGAILRAARKARDLTVDEVATRLRLMHRQIEAMEADDFASLGQPVFARGFVRNYARLLQVAPEPLLARMGGDTSEHAEVVQAPPATEMQSLLTSPWLLAAALGLALLVALPIALYFWLNSGEEEAVVPHPAQTPVAAAPATLPAPASAPVSASAPLPAPVPVPTGNPEPAVKAAATPTSEVREQAVSDTSEPKALGTVHFDFDGDAWVEVKDASGRMLHRQLDTAGSSVDIVGQPPFEFLVGNAAQVRMSYNGRPLDLKPYIDVTVARFSLEE
jgi:cytoskeleton protein RodZ